MARESSSTRRNKAACADSCLNHLFAIGVKADRRDVGKIGKPSPEPVKLVNAWMILTQLGDIAVTAPAALAIAALLWLEGLRRSSIRWAVLFTCGSLLVVATKMAFIGWGMGSSRLDFTGASGHAMRAAAIAPVLLHLICRQAPRHSRLAWMALAYLLAASIGISRVVLHAHSISEVVAGWLIGLMASLYFIRQSGESRKPVLNPKRIAAGAAVVLATAFRSSPAPTQQWLIQATLYVSGHEKPFVRPTGKAARACP